MAISRLLVLGATGGTGRHVLAEALKREWTVTALVRDPGRLAGVTGRLQVITGDIADSSTLDRALKEQDAVISTLGVGRSFKSGGLIETGVRAILPAMERAGVRRIVFTSAFGIGDTWRDTPFLPRIFIKVMLRDVYRDKAAGEALLRASGLDWTIVYPTGLTDAPATGRFRVGERLPLRGFPGIARADLADCLVRQIEDAGTIRKGFLASA